MLRPMLDAASRAYWEGRSWLGRRRISMFSRNVYRHGLLGRFIGVGHRVARLYGVEPERHAKADTWPSSAPSSQRRSRRCSTAALIRWATARKSSLFGLGIPPQQYDALAGAGTATWQPFCKTAARKARLRLSDRRELFRLAGLRPPLWRGRPAAALSSPPEFRHAARTRRSASVVNASFTDCSPQSPTHRSTASSCSTRRTG